jgi:hypothetical protein
MTQRRFPPSWSIEESAACFIVRDGDKRQIARRNPVTDQSALPRS